MFTGIIEELGVMKKINKQGNTLKLTIQGQKILKDVNLGDSIAINGVCLTVTDFTDKLFEVDVMPETFKSTSLSSLKEGSLVNLERAMAANGRFGGHFVTGHVDGVGQIVKKTPKENAIYIEIAVPENFEHWTLLKGSIAIDGTSLTIFGLEDNHVTVSIIPHTAQETVLGMKKAGDIVNIEFDMIAKYLHRFFIKGDTSNQPKKGVTGDFLRENGFM
ncbi:riboflavin synthase [Bacillus sp. 31A1R]|uniref:Riboflavin synthase n=1 Tax=Robertmurraya mangrovi TaxID=3098077 RepID=A0ABU5J335_9BACI|nr:riboflavin synthase [Bacillus sp. 31A1R]MDZ5473809.1 riboflavin synthase [Bacillus sp. 31A1R]